MSELTQNTTSLKYSLLGSKIPRKTAKGKEPDKVQNYGDIVPLRWSKIMASRARKSYSGRGRLLNLPLRPRLLSDTNTHLQASPYSIWAESNDPRSSVSPLHEQHVLAGRELSDGSGTSLKIQSRQPSKSYSYSGSSIFVQPIPLTKRNEQLWIPRCTNGRIFPLSRFLAVFESRGKQLSRDLEVHLSRALIIISRIEAGKEAAVSGVPNPQSQPLEKWRTHLWEWRTDVGNMARFLITSAVDKIDYEDDAYSYFDLKATSLYFWWRVCKMVRKIVVMTSWPSKMTDVKGTFLMMQRLFGGMWKGLANAFVRDVAKLQKGDGLPRDPLRKSKRLSSLIDTGLFNTIPKLWPPAHQKIPRILRRVHRQYSSDFSEYLSKAKPQLKNEISTLEELKELHRGLLTGSVKIEGTYEKVAKLLNSAPKMLEEFANFIPPNLLPIYNTERDNAIAKVIQHHDEYNTFWSWTVANGLRSLRQSLDHRVRTQPSRATQPEEAISFLLVGLEQASRNVLKFDMSQEISLMFEHLALVMKEQNRLYQLCIPDVQDEFRDKIPQHVAEYVMEICMKEAINRMREKEMELERAQHPEILKFHHPVANHSTEVLIGRKRCHKQTSISWTARDIWSSTTKIPKSGCKGKTAELSQRNHHVEHQNAGASRLSLRGGGLFPPSGIIEDEEEEASDSRSGQLNQIGPLYYQQKDGRMFHIICVDCEKDNFSFGPLFITHCRVYHKRNFLNFEEAVVICGQLVERKDFDVNAVEVNHLGIPTGQPIKSEEVSNRILMDRGMKRLSIDDVPSNYHKRRSTEVTYGSNNSKRIRNSLGGWDANIPFYPEAEESISAKKIHDPFFSHGNPNKVPVTRTTVQLACLPDYYNIHPSQENSSLSPQTRNRTTSQIGSQSGLPRPQGNVNGASENRERTSSTKTQGTLVLGSSADDNVSNPVRQGGGQTSIQNAPAPQMSPQITASLRSNGQNHQKVSLTHRKFAEVCGITYTNKITKNHRMKSKNAPKKQTAKTPKRGPIDLTIDSNNTDSHENRIDSIPLDPVLNEKAHFHTNSETKQMMRDSNEEFEVPNDGAINVRANGQQAAIDAQAEKVQDAEEFDNYEQARYGSLFDRLCHE